MYINRSIAFLLKFKTSNRIKNWVAGNCENLPEAYVEQLLKTGELKARMCHRLVIKMKFKQ